MDSEMVMEIPDTPERVAFTRSVGESSSHTHGIEESSSSFSQYFEPKNRMYSRQMKNFGNYDFISNPDRYPQPLRSSVLKDSGTNPVLIELSPESPFPRPHPIRNRGARHKEDSHLNRHSVRNDTEHDKLGIHDFSGHNAVPLDDDFLFTQARIARSIYGTHDSKPTHPNNISSEPGRSNVSNSGISSEIELSQVHPLPLSCPTGHREARHEEKYLGRQRESNEISSNGELGVRALISTGDLGKEKINVSNSSNTFGSSNKINEAETMRCHARVVPSQQEKVIVRLSSRTKTDRLPSRHPEISFPQSAAQQNKLPNGYVTTCDLSKSSNNSQLKPNCRDLAYIADQRAPCFADKNQGIVVGAGSWKASHSMTGQANHNHLNVLNPKRNGHRMLVRNGCISPSNISKNKNDCKAKDIEKGGSIASKMHNCSSSQSAKLDEVLHPKNNGHRRAVHNGFISSSNISRSNDDAKAKGLEEGVVSCKMHIGNSTKLIHSSSFGLRGTDKEKGKEIINEELADSQQNWTTIPTARRSCLIPGKETIIISDLDYDTSRSFDSCGATQKNEPEVAIFQPGEKATQVQTNFKLDSEAPQHTGKRKNSSTHSNTGECSSSSVDICRRSYDRRSSKTSYSRSIRSRKSVRADAALAPIVEIDELTSAAKQDILELSDESLAKSIQLESDEALARQLQEQFYLESPPVRAAEERSLLLEEEYLHASFRRENPIFQREALFPTFLGGPRFHHQFTRATARARAENGIGRVRRSISRPIMSVEERIDLLEALQAEFENADDMDTPDHFLGTQLDFNENDYEMLLALDDNNHHGGATARQINNLPQSLIQKSDSEEPCAVCLEFPSVGDTVRHLPCLHKFHKDCIDTWLRRKSSCPICKCGIT